MRSRATLSFVSLGLAVLAAFAGHPRASSSQATPATPPGHSAISVESRAAWVWGSTVRSEGADAVAGTLQARGMTDAILLVKGTAGTVSYPSAIAPQVAGDADTLGQFVAACHARGIRVHAWLNYHQDDAYGTKTKRAFCIWHLGKDGAPPYAVNDGRICPLRANEGYNEYFLGIVQEILDRYDVDGIHLDYIRYPHVVYCFCPAHQAHAATLGIDATRVRALLRQTLYPAPGDGKTFYNLLAAGDPDVTGWVAMREQEVNGVIRKVKEVVDGHNATHAAAGGGPVRLSAALMPEGALSDMETDQARRDQWALCYYAQNYATLSPLVSFIAPMAYHKDFNKPPAWVGEVTAGAVAKAAPTGVWSGIQVYSVPVQDVPDALAAAREGGASGFALFRYGVSSSGEQASSAVVPSIDSLRAATASALEAGSIDNGVGTSLRQKLRTIEMSLDAGDTTTAASQLTAYVNELEAQTGKHVDPRAARALATDAGWLRDLLVR